MKYSDGSPLTAENFRYAVERTCDPVTAGEYQSILFEIVGCAEFASLALDDGWRTHVALGEMLARLGRHDAANAHLAAALKLALGELTRAPAVL